MSPSDDHYKRLIAKISIAVHGERVQDAVGVFTVMSCNAAMDDSLTKEQFVRMVDECWEDVAATRRAGTN